MYQKLLCPIDGSDTSKRGMATAIQLAKDQRAQLRFLHVIDFSALALYTPLADDTFDTVRNHGQKILDDAVQAARAQGVAADASAQEIFVGHISGAVVEAAADYGADLIVMGTHGRRGIGRVLLGSDAAAVVGATAAPVLLVK